MLNKGRHPKWVHQVVGNNQKAKRINGQYHLFEMESGNEVLIGTITPEGIIESEQRTWERTCTVYEYGASKALTLLCPAQWKDSVGFRWEENLLFIISEISPTSYLLKHKGPECSGMMHLARKKLDLFMLREYGHSISEIYATLGGIRLLIDNDTGEQRISTASEEQAAFIRSLNIELEVL